ncbi:MAG TPA: hypothetical protein VL332_08355 [Candidatus Saccharimonadaceae bacterium]|jgi:hypothetical protein|nr:hypothetical protein [Candidatus Saccharimonadaceae bacterium]
MTARLRICALALAGLALAVAVAVAAATPDGTGASAPRVVTPAPHGARASAPHAAPPARRAAARPGGDAKAAKRTAVTPATGPRTLGDVHIEGEIAAPQVLFITARDQRRFVEFQHHRYLSTSRELGARTAFPTRIVSDAPPVPPQPEASR